MYIVLRLRIEVIHRSSHLCLRPSHSESLNITARPKSTERTTRNATPAWPVAGPNSVTQTVGGGEGLFKSMTIRRTMEERGANWVHRRGMNEYGVMRGT